MNNRNIGTTHIVTGVAATILILLGINIFLRMDPQQLNTSALKEVEQARAKWETQNIQTYEFQLEDKSYMSCEGKFRVHNEQGVTLNTNCDEDPARPQTVSDMFEEIEQTAKEKRCGQNGCACDGPISVSATYQEDYGHPLNIKIAVQHDERWRYFNYWNPFRSCTLIASMPPIHYEVTEFAVVTAID